MENIGSVSLVKSDPISFDINPDENNIACVITPTYQNGVAICDENPASKILASELQNLLWNSLFLESSREIEVTITTNKSNRMPHNQAMEIRVSGSFIDHCAHLVGKDNLKIMQVKFEDMQRSGTSLQARSNPTSSDYSKELAIELPTWSSDGNKVTFQGIFSYVDTIFNVFFWSDYTSYQGKITVNLLANVHNLELQPLVSCREFQRKLLVEQHETDITIETENGYSVGCHKIFLTGQSSVFKTMLDNRSTEEGASNTIHIYDMSAEGVKALLNFLYHTTDDPTLCPFQIAMELLHASQKYGIERLKIALITGFQQKSLHSIKLEDALQLFYYTRNSPGFEKLQVKAAQVMKANIKKLIAMDEYKNLFVESPQIAMELCNAIFTAK